MKAWLAMTCILVATVLSACTSRVTVEGATISRGAGSEESVRAELAERIARHGSRMLAATRVESALASAVVSDFLVEGAYGSGLMVECERMIEGKGGGDGT